MITEKARNVQQTGQRVNSKWTVKELGMIATFLNGKAFNQNELFGRGKYRVLRVGNFFTSSDWYYSDLELEESKYVEDGDLMYAWSASFGPKFWSGEKTIYHYHIWKVLPTALVTKEYLFYFLDYDTQRLLNNKQGGTMFHVTKGDMEKRKIPLPPLPEQRKIALILSTWDRAIEKTEELIAQKQQLRKGLMQQLLTGKVRFKEFVKSTKMKKTKLGLVPEDWTVVDVNHLTLDHKQGYYTNDPYTKHGRYLLLRGTDMLNPTIDLKTTPRIDASQNDYELFKAEVGDILIVRSGGIGRYGIVKEPLLGIFGSYLIRFRLDNKLILNDFFGLFYQSFISLNQLKSITQGSSNININAENIKSLKVPLPSIEEQKSILVLLLSLEKKISMNNTLLLNLKRQKHGLMQQLLTGKVRVKI